MNQNKWIMIMKQILWLFLILIIFLSELVWAQNYYGPTGLEFTHDDYAITTSYIVEYWSEPPGTAPLFSITIPKEKILIISPPLYRISLQDLPIVPIGTTYRFILRAIGTGGTSEPSNITPESATWSYCVEGTIVKPMTITLGTIPESWPTKGYTQIQFDIQSPLQVKSASATLLGSGSPANYYTSKEDLRGMRSYTIGPLPRVGSFWLLLEAQDEQGCRVEIATQRISIK